MMNTSRWVFYEAQVHLLLDAFYAMHIAPNSPLSQLSVQISNFRGLPFQWNVAAHRNKKRFQMSRCEWSCFCSVQRPTVGQHRNSPGGKTLLYHTSMPF